jgi:hypothetical protein
MHVPSPPHVYFVWIITNEMYRGACIIMTLPPVASLQVLQPLRHVALLARTRARRRRRCSRRRRGGRGRGRRASAVRAWPPAIKPFVHRPVYFLSDSIFQYRKYTGSGGNDFTAGGLSAPALSPWSASAVPNLRSGFGRIVVSENDRGTESLSKSGVERMYGGTKRQRGRALGRTRCSARPNR